MELQDDLNDLLALENEQMEEELSEQSIRCVVAVITCSGV